MSFTDLANVAGQAPQPPPQQQQQDPSQLPPDPRSFSQSPTNPASRSFQVASVGDAAAPAGLESDRDLGDVSKTKDKTEDTAKTDELYPPVEFAPSIYRPPAPDRGPSGWGQDWTPVTMAANYPGPAPGPDMPSPAESYREIQSYGNTMSKWGPPAVAEPASQAGFLATPFGPLLDAISQGKFSRNFTIANLRAIQIRQAEMLERQEQASNAHQQVLTQAGSILKQAELGVIPPQEAERRLYEWSLVNHPVLAEAIKAQGLRGAVNWLNWEDAQYRRGLAASTQLRKTTNADADQREADVLSGRQSSVGGGAGALGIDPNALPGRGGQQPGPAEMPADQQAGDQTTATTDEQIAGQLGLKGDPALGRGIMEQAHRALNGLPGNYELQKGGRAVNQIGQATAALQHRIDQIANYDDPKMDPEIQSQQKLDAIKRTDPDQAALIQGLKDLRIDPNSAEMTHGTRRHLVTLASKIYPNWNEGAYHQFQTVWNNANSRESQQLQAANRAATQLVVFEASVNRLKIPEDSTFPANVWNQWKTQGYTTDPQFAALNEPLRAMATEFVYMQGGRSQVTAVQQFLREAPLNGGKAQLRTLARQGSIGGLHTMEQQVGQFQRQTGLDGTPPSLDEGALQVFGDFARSNPNTGMFPSDATPELKSIEPSAEQRARMPKWLRDNPSQQFEPMGKKEWEGLRATIEKMRKDNPNDPRLPQLLHEFGIRQ